MSSKPSFAAWLESRYEADPDKFGRFAGASLRLVSLRRRRWRGQRIIKNSKVEVDGRAVNEKSITRSRWDLIPDRVKALFSSLEASADQVMAMCVSSGASDDEARAGVSLLNRGIYAIPSPAWAAFDAAMTKVAEAWDRTADQLCTEDGYAELVKEIEDKLGAEDFQLAQRYVPTRAELRPKFGLEWSVLPVSLEAAPSDDAARKAGTKAVALEVLEAVVRGPRERLAEACSNFANVLTVPTPGGGWAAKQTVRKDKHGNPVPGKRGVQTDSVRAVRTAIDEFLRYQGFADAETVAMAKALSTRVAAADGPARAIARRLTDDDDEALDLAADLRTMAEVAADETRMCQGLEGKF
jgi:hypothetical protein